MRKVVLVWASLACAGLGQRKLLSIQELQSRTILENEGPVKATDADARLQKYADTAQAPWKAFSLLLLALKPVAAFSHCRPGSRGLVHDSDPMKPAVRALDRRKFLSTCVMGAGDDWTPKGHLRKQERLPVRGIMARRSALALAASIIPCTLLRNTPQALALDMPLQTVAPVSQTMGIERDASSSASIGQGSTLAQEVFDLLDRKFIDRKFNGFDMKKFREELDKAGPLSEKEALKKAQYLVDKMQSPFAVSSPRLMDPKEYFELIRNFDELGFGLNLRVIDNEVKVLGVPPDDTEGARAGMGYGDVVTAINGKSTAGITDDYAIDEMLQSDGQTVTFKFKPARGGVEKEVALQKKVDKSANPVSYRVYERPNGEGKTGYIRMKEFSAQAVPGMREAANQLAKVGVNLIVLDLRGNQGGLLEGAIKVTGLFSKEPLVLYLTDANGEMQPKYSQEPAVLSKIPMQVWIDQKTASAAEIVAASLHDNCRAPTIGGLTYGKGIIQDLYGLSNGGGLVEVVSTYRTPSKEDIDKKGVRADVDRAFLSNLLGDSALKQDIDYSSRDGDIRKRACLKSPFPE